MANETVLERHKVEKGYVGETYVMAKLMRDYNIASVKVPQPFYSYDLITSNNKRLEIKTALITKSARKHPKKTYYSECWEFTRSPKQHSERSSDFIVSICFQKDFSDEPRCFIIPTKELHGLSATTKISAKQKRKRQPKYWNYENKWDLIASSLDEITQKVKI